MTTLARRTRRLAARYSHALIALGGRYRHALIALAVAAVAALGFVALRLALHQVHLSDVRAALGAVPRWRIAAAVGLTMLSYLALTGYDWAALRTIGRPLPWRIGAAGSFTSYTLSHNLGLAMLTGGSARYRVYSAAGLDLREVAQVGAVAGIGFWAGVIGTAGLALIAAPGALKLGDVALASWQARGVGVALVALVAILPGMRIAGLTSLGRGAIRLPVPSLGMQAMLAAVSLVDLAAASAALFVLVPGLDAAVFPAFFVAYAAAIVVALVTHVPGGLGVFETVMLTMLPADRPAVFAGLLLYRLVYYLLPLLVAGGGVALAEGYRLRRPVARGLSLIDRAGQMLAPTAVTLLVCVTGLVLLVSGALPGVKTRLTDLDGLVPLPFIEGSHLAGSLIGTALLLVAPALNARLRSGFDMARLLLAGAAVFSLLKGFDYEEAGLTLAVLAVLHYAQGGFYRRGRLASEPIDWGWLAVAAIAVALSIWAGFFAYQRVPYSDDLWWHFALDGNAPRFLRASFAAGVLLAATALWHVVTRRAAPPAGEPIDEAVLARAMAAAERTDANLALTGDKSFIVSASRDAFLMYRVQGGTWVVMGDPVGPPAAWGELAWAIRRACDAAGGRLCFFQASAAMLPLIVELGLEAIKYGEEAQVDLAGFTLAGPKAKGFRHALRRADEAGLTFAVMPAASVPGALAALGAVSDAWLADKAKEKRFSLGAFDADYLARFDCAVIRDRDGRIIAFANIWTMPDGAELSVDLMRHLPDAPYGTMDMMFVKLFEWGRAQGYCRFNLGMAPLSGLTGGRLAPLWAKLGRALFDNGDALYGFAGLRAFKQKFGPAWTPRYIATPRRTGMARALIDVARLVSA